MIFCPQKSTLACMDVVYWDHIGEITVDLGFHRRDNGQTLSKMTGFFFLFFYIDRPLVEYPVRERVCARACVRVQVCACISREPGGLSDISDYLGDYLEQSPSFVPKIIHPQQAK